MSTVIQASTEIDLEDAAVARKEPKNSDRELVGRLVEQARAETHSLTTAARTLVRTALSPKTARSRGPGR
jgi:hypothetical protein